MPARSFWIRAAVTGAVLALLFWKIDGAGALRALARLDPSYAVATLALLAVDRVVMVWRWIALLRATGQRVATKSAVWIYLVSSFVGSFLPAGVGADVARAYTLTQRTSDGGAAIASVAADRVLGLMSIILVGLVGAITWEGTDRFPIVIAGALTALAGCVTLLWADAWARSVIPTRLHPSLAVIRVFRYADALAAYRGHRGTLALVLALSIGVQLLRIAQAYLLGRGIDIDVPFDYYLVFMPIGLIGLLLPISISGFGAPQGLIVWLLLPAGVPEASALALSTLIVLTGIIGNVPGALLYLRTREQRTHR